MEQDLSHCFYNKGAKRGYCWQGKRHSHMRSILCTKLYETQLIVFGIFILTNCWQHIPQMYLCSSIHQLYPLHLARACPSQCCVRSGYSQDSSPVYACSAFMPAVNLETLVNITYVFEHMSVH